MWSNVLSSNSTLIFSTEEAETHCLKITQNVAFDIFNFGIIHHFFPIKSDLSGNTVCKLQAFKDLTKLTIFGIFHQCKRSSLRSQCWMRLFLWFSNTVWEFKKEVKNRRANLKGKCHGQGLLSFAIIISGSHSFFRDFKTLKKREIELFLTDVWIFKRKEKERKKKKKKKNLQGKNFLNFHYSWVHIFQWKIKKK